LSCRWCPCWFHPRTTTPARSHSRAPRQCFPPGFRRFSRNSQLLPCLQLLLSITLLTAQSPALRSVGDKTEVLAPGRLRQLRHQPQGNGDFVQLEVRPQERDSPVRSRLAGHFCDFNASFL